MSRPMEHTGLPEAFATGAYPDCLAHLDDELQKLDLMLTRRIHSFRQSPQAVEAAVRAAPTYVTDEEVDWLLNQAHDRTGADQTIDALDAALEAKTRSIAEAVDASVENNVFLPLAALVRQFELSACEADIIAICLAPELRRRYDRIYAYLQDDISRRRPSIDLVLDILFDAEADRWRARALFGESAPLRRHNIVHFIDETHGLTGSTQLSRYLRLDERIVDYLTGAVRFEAAPDDVAALREPGPPPANLYTEPELQQQVFNVFERSVAAGPRRRLWLHLHGRRGVGKKTLALSLCRHIGCPLLVVDLRKIAGRAEEAGQWLHRACRESILSQVPVYFEHTDCIDEREPAGAALINTLTSRVREYGWLVFSAGEQPLKPVFDDETLVFHRIDLTPPAAALRTRAWRDALEHLQCDNPETAARTLAERYAFTPAQIAAAAQTALAAGLAGARGSVDFATLVEACQAESVWALEHMAVRIRANYGWDDLVLPEADLSTLRAICQQVKHRHTVFDRWGFDRKIVYGRGLSVLFSGKPGTGKTMAAQVIAADLGLQLYKIDLSGVVSKYIGETEKNLDRIFTAAQAGNAILFFDEADALFGKRTEISDAHDRYANIETSYLLQKMEEYDGIVILASNYRRNMDEAFVRRIRFIVEFPFPNAEQRREIWHKTIPGDAPLDKHVDFHWLAEQMKISGGSIKNIVLNAAFYAAEQDTKLGMTQLAMSCRNEYKKMGKLWDEASMAYPGRSTTVSPTVSKEP